MVVVSFQKIYIKGNRMNRTREDWLREAAILLNEDILSKYKTCLPELWKVSVGFPSSASAIGQAWDKEACEDGKTHHIFISPELGNHDKVQLLQVLLHECIHIAVGIDQKHGGEFKRVARDIGLEGRLTATYVSSDNPLYQQLLDIYHAVGWEYPHVTLKKNAKPKKEREKTQTVLVSVNDEGYVVKIKNDVLESLGFPVDPWGDEMVVKEE